MPDWQRQAAWLIYNDPQCKSPNAKESIDRIEEIIKKYARLAKQKGLANA